MGHIFYLLLLILLFLTPFIVLYYHRWLNNWLKVSGLKLKTPDLITIFLFFTIYLFSSIAFGTSGFLIFIVIVALSAIGLITYYLRNEQMIEYVRFLRVWWRLTFLIGMVFYIICGIVAIITLSSH
ncbi:DUF3397 family protein [Dolosigranulum pigrum]|uniref:DUF3397 domain-containing protein n=1 Tax=Dolosigranulum pigrum TaxID=29394 RepID=A0A516GJK8_9LACT|nr:DUF3397 family protein [Dolosigranulum pigrum]QDO91696.1 DUF3397 domain-containing protein [Dolosigranulum pigrum]